MASGVSSHCTVLSLTRRLADSRDTTPGSRARRPADAPPGHSTHRTMAIVSWPVTGTQARRIEVSGLAGVPWRTGTGYGGVTFACCSRMTVSRSHAQVSRHAVPGDDPTPGGAAHARACCKLTRVRPA